MSDNILNNKILLDIINLNRNDVTNSINGIFFLCVSFILMIISFKLLNKKNKDTTVKLESSLYNSIVNKEEIVDSYLKYLQNEITIGIKSKQNLQTDQCQNLNDISLNSKYPVITVYYATQSNTSKNFSLNLKSELKEKGIKLKVKNISDFEDNELNTNCLILFLVSTYGEGEPTDDAVEFFNKKINHCILKYNNTINPFLKYAIFGLGSKKYEKFNQTAKILEDNLNKALTNEHKLTDIYLGDDSCNNIRKDFETWKYNYLFPSIISNFNNIVNNNDKSIKEKYELFIKKNNLINNNTNDDNEDSKEFEIKIFTDNNLNKNKITEGFQINRSDYEYSIRSFLDSKSCNITKIEELRQGKLNGSTLKVIYNTLNKDNNYLKYESGDNIGIFPVNKESDIMYIIKRLKLDPESRIKIIKHKQKLSKKIGLVDNMSIRQSITEIIDLNCKVTKQILKDLTKFTKNEEEFNIISNILNNESLIDGFEGCNYNIIDILKTFFSIEMSFVDLYNLLPKISPRYYTVASSPNDNKDILEIAISIVSHKTTYMDNTKLFSFSSNSSNNSMLIPVNNNNTETRLGLTSSNISLINDNFALSNGEVYKSKLLVRQSGFKLPSNPNASIIMIATGTGVAPFISFLREIKSLNLNNSNRDLVLVFGSKNSNQDFIYKEEIYNYIHSGLLTKLFTAFSRDDNKKVYVQHKIMENKDYIDRLIKKKNAYIFICGGVNMGSDVMKTIEEIIGLPDVKKLENEKRLFKELWG